MRRVAKRHSAAFTLVELIVVVTVIALILAIAIPGLSAMGSESRYNAGVQTVNGALLRAYYAALADNTPTAVRFVPGAWDNDPTDSGQQPGGRQHIVTYSYVATSVDPTNMQMIKFDEYFQRRAGSPSVQLPENVWVAPVEALDTDSRTLAQYSYGNFGRDFVLAGGPANFRVDANPVGATPGLFQADDFMIVFDPQVGMRSVITPLTLRAYVPPPPDGTGPAPKGIETHEWPIASNINYSRYNFTGVTFYGREAFLSLGRGEGLGYERQSWLRQNSRPYLVHRFSGGLVMGTQGTETE